MQLIVASLAALSLASTALATASFNTSQEYYLKTSLKAGQRTKSRFNNLYVVAYHTGAGLNDAVLANSTATASKGYLNTTNYTQADGQPFYEQLFDLEGATLPYGLVVDETANEYAAWEPVRINAGDGNVGFFINGTGLQYFPYANEGETYDAFGGWIACEWWHGSPQLFQRVAGYDDKAPCSCADVDLIPEYI